MSSSSHVDHLQKPVLIRDDKIEWLDFGATPDPGNLQAHPGFVWVKSGYSESIAWRKVRLTKQRNVNLTTDGLWAMPLNTGWVPIKARRLQDWEKPKKICSNSQAGGCVPQWGPCPCGKMTTIRIQNNQRSLEHCSVLCIVQFEALFPEKCDHLPPPPKHTFLKRPFLTDFKKYTHTPPPPPQ